MNGGYRVRRSDTTCQCSLGPDISETSERLALRFDCLEYSSFLLNSRRARKKKKKARFEPEA